MQLFQEPPGSLFATEATLLALFIIIILVGIAARYFRLPYTTVLVIAGLGLEALGVLPGIELTPELVLLLFLPPLAFEAAFHLDFERLRQDLTPVAVLALLGVVISMAVAGAVLVMALKIPWEIALLFGTLIAATDPVSVVAVFRELGVAKRLSTLMESESLFNDGTSIVLFRLVLAVVLTGAFHPIDGLVEFLRLVVGGMALGFGLGYLASRFLSRIDDYLIEISLTVVLAWGSYLLGEYLQVSGVIATVVAGLVLGNLGGRIAFSPTTKIVLEHVLEFLSFVANSFIFLLIGLQVNFIDLRTNGVVIFWAIVAALVARAVAVYGLALPLSRFSNPIPLKWQHLLFWGGLRGGGDVGACTQSADHDTRARDLGRGGVQRRALYPRRAGLDDQTVGAVSRPLAQTSFATKLRDHACAFAGCARRGTTAPHVAWRRRVGRQQLQYVTRRIGNSNTAVFARVG